MPLINIHTLRGRTILHVTGQVVIFLAAILYTTFQVSKNLEQVRENFRQSIISKTVLAGRSKADDLGTSILYYAVDEGTKILDGMVKDTQMDISMAIVVGPDGHVIFADNASRMSMQVTLEDQERALARGEYYLHPQLEKDSQTGEDILQLTLVLSDAQGGEPQGYLVMGIPQAKIDAKMAAADSVRADVRNWLFGLMLFLVLSNLGGYFVMSQIMVKPLATLQRSAEAMASGDLSSQVDERTRQKRDEVGALALSFHQMGDSIRRVVGSIQMSLSAVIEATGRIGESSQAVAGSSRQQSESVNRTTSSMEEIGLAIGRTAENVDVLAASSEESSSSILELNAIIDEISENVEQLAAAVEDTTSSISQMNSSIHQVKENVDQLSVSADETASSISEMDATIKQVEANAEQTAKLAEGFAEDASVGVGAVNATIESIQKVQESSQGAARVMQTLGERIDEIGKILNVIDDVAEQTNLLALNAAIIAAQAGEHGKSFAVVADEIKDLAERTAASTAEIATIIKSVQSESARAISSVFGSTRLVEEGVQRSQQAGGILRRIADSSVKATSMVREIARATVEQARGSAQITGAIEKIVSMVSQINVATTEQARGSTQIMTAAQKMKEITILVRGATREQSKGAKQINEAMDRVIQMVEYINSAIKEQRGGSSQVLSEMEAIRKNMEANVNAVKAMDNAMQNLRQQAKQLEREVSQFSL